MGIKDEFEFIKKISLTQKQGLHHDIIVGIGDDAAVVKPPVEMNLLACTDTMVEGIHFKRETMSPYHIGYKALTANISDIAAMGGIPTYFLVSIAIPKNWQENELLEIYSGMEIVAKHNEVKLIGGDTVSTNGPLVVNVTVLGKVEKDSCLKRSNAKAGDIVFLTGTVGDSAAGLHIIVSEKAKEEHFRSLVMKHQIPNPQIQAGRILVQFEGVSANDISDGVASEAKEIAEASNVDLILDASCIPLSMEILFFGRTQALEWALFGGEDYELLGTASKENWIKILKRFKELNLPISMVGSVQKGTGNVYLKENSHVSELARKGFNHFD